MNKNWLYIIITLSFALHTPIGYSAQNPSLRNPAGVTTTPPSHISNSLVDTSNPIDTSGNRIVTGNVRRGMHFRGDVPYRSTSSFSSTLGSATLSSFMRDSAGAEDFGSNRSRTTVGSASGTNYQPYHLPSATVTTLSQNRPGVTTQANTRTNNRPQNVSDPQTSLNQPAISNWGTSAQAPALWHLYNPGLAGAQAQYNMRSETQPISSSPRLNEQQTQGQLGRYPQNESVRPQQSRQQTQTNPNTIQNSRSNSQFNENRMTVPQTEQSLRSSQQTTDQINQWQQTSAPPRYGTQEPAPAITAGESAPVQTQRLKPTQNRYQTLATSEFTSTREHSPLAPYQSGNLEQSLPVTDSTAYQPSTVSRPMSTQQYQGQSGRIPNATQDVGTSEAIAQIQKQLDDLIRSIDSRLQTPTVGTTQSGTTREEIPDFRQTGTSYRPGQENRSRPGLANERQVQALTGLPDISESKISQNNISPPAEMKQLSQAEISARAKRIMGQHTDYESFSQAKYNQLYRAAEKHLDIGRFYQAADAFALAAIYNPDDPLCYAGRGHALFAAGKYVSSALHLIRAIEIDPEYINTPIDFEELLGDAEDLNTKIAELNKWLQKSDAPGLGFLLGYVYYHTGKLSKAKQVMDVVLQEMPQSKAAMALKMAIDAKLKIQQ